MLWETSTSLDDLSNYFEAFFKLQPDNIDYQIFYAQNNYLIGNIDVAKDQLRRVFKQDFKNPKALLTYADCLLH